MVGVGGLITYGGPSTTADILKLILKIKEETVKNSIEIDESAPSPDSLIWRIWGKWREERCTILEVGPRYTRSRSHLHS